MNIFAIITAIASTGTAINSYSQGNTARNLMYSAKDLEAQAAEDAGAALWEANMRIEAYKEFQEYQDEVASKQQIVMISSIAVGVISALVFVVQIRRS